MIKHPNYAIIKWRLLGGLTMKKVEDNAQQASTRKQLSKLDEERTKFIDKKIQRNKDFAIVAGAVAAVSATTVLGNIIIPNYQVAIQNSGTLLAMITYSLAVCSL